MSINTSVADIEDNVAVETNSEGRGEAVFFAIVAVVLGAMVAAGALFGLGGVGAVAIAEAAVMLVVCLALTRG